MAGLGGSGESRRTHRTPERLEQILGALRTGATRGAAAGYADMSHDTLWRWMRADANVRSAVRQAEATAEIRMTAIVADAAFGRPAQYDDMGRQIRAEVKPNPIHAEYWLDRRRRQEWGHHITVDVRAAIERYAVENGLDPDEVQAEAEAIIAAAVAQQR